MTAASETEDKKIRRPTPADWAEARNLWELGEMRAQELCERLGVTRSALHQHFAKHKSYFGSRKKDIEAKAEEVVSTFAMKRKQRIEETKTQTYELDSALNAYARKMLSDAIKGTATLSSREKELKALHKLAVVNTLTRQGRYHVLDADNEIDENELPEIRFKDLSKEDIEALRRTDDDDDLEDLMKIAEDDIVVEEKS
jgi:AcrR family transcriptional regulator